MLATETEFSRDVFKFSGQTVFDTWKLREVIEKAGWGIYSDWLVDELPFCLQRIRDLADGFPYWQRRKSTGRPPIEERTLLIGFMVRQFFNVTFRQLEGLMKIFRDFFFLKTIPDYSVFSKKNSNSRWINLWKRFHRYVLNLLPQRTAVIATDATGYSGRKRPWKDTDHGIRAIENWIKAHTAVEVESFIILNYELTRANVHESQMYEKVWSELPENVDPIRSLADSAYTSEQCIQVAKKNGATPIHAIKENAVYRRKPATGYEKLVYHAKCWVKRFKKLIGQRSHIETVFSMVSECFSYRLRCRNEVARKNEVQAKFVSHNVRLLAASRYMNAAGV